MKLKYSIHPSQIVFLIAILIVTCINFLDLTRQTKNILKLKKYIPYQFEGYKFSGLQTIFKDIEIVSYMTDKDIKNDKHAKQFAQAQFMVVPTILELNNPEHKYLLFDYEKEENAFKKIKELNAIALKKNKFGIILAQKR